MTVLSPRRQFFALVTLAILLTLGISVWARAQFNGVAPESFVHVVNLGNPHPVTGTVTMDQPVPHSRFHAVPEVVVSPARRNQTTQITDPGIVIETEGFTYVTLSLQGQIKGLPVADGIVGAILLPDEEPFLRAFREEGLLQLPLEVKAEVEAQRSDSFAATLKPAPVAFPRYRVLLYNSTDKTASAYLYAYLAH